jgi:chromosome segregation protein
VNPLALEEFEAMSERHRFLAEQLDDLKRTRTDLLGIIADVDARVEQVFAEAYADVEVAFEHSFARLFPGGEGRLVLTEPGSWLTTGVDVEARPAGKKVKRLSLLSGGERSLVAVAFLVGAVQAPARARSTSSTRWRRPSTTPTSAACWASTRSCARTARCS